MRRQTILALALVAAAAAPAHAGRGATYGSIMDAIRSHNADTIISELERAERLVCGACVQPVMQLLDDSDPRVREAAAWWFARRPALKAAITVNSIARLAGADPTLARNAADVLGTFRHPDAIPALSAVLDRSDLPSSVHAAALRALGTIGHPSAEPAVIKGLSDAGADARLAAVQAYDDLRGDRDGSPLVGLLSDADAGVRRLAAAVLGGHHTVSARAQLEAVLAGDADALARRNAAWALMQLADPASRAALQAAADNDAVSFVRSVARAALSSLP